MKLPITGLLAAGALITTASAQTTFETAPSGLVTTTAGNSFDVDWADIDGDGDLDLYVTNGNAAVGNDLFVNQGDGTFIARIGDSIVTALANSSAAVFADIDGDDDLDVFVTNRNGADNFLFINDGGLQAGTPGDFTRDFASIVANDAGNSLNAAFGDVDGDGDADLFVVNDGEDNALYRNTGSGFTKVLVGAYVTDGGDSTDVSLADYDGDGDLDVFVANDSGRDGFYYTNNGGGVLTKITGVPQTSAGGDTKASAAGDIDGDGDSDLLLANFFATNNLFLNQGGAQGGTEGTFVDAPAGDYTADLRASFDIRLFDWDMDGDLDIASGNCCGQDNSFYVNGGVGIFAKVTQGPHVNDGGYSVATAFGDYDQDGTADLAVANITSSGSNLNFLYANRSPGSLERQTSGPLATDVLSPFDLVTGDLDADGDEDVVLLTTSGAPNGVYLNQGGDQLGTEGEFLADVGSGLASGTSSAYYGKLVDIDGDTDLDLVVANRSGGDNEIWINQGGAQAGTSGTFAAVVGDPAVTSGGNTRATDVADVNGDGLLDIVYGNAGGQDNELFINQGGSTWALDATSALVGLGGATFGTEFGDVDGDGDQDLFISNRNGEANVLLQNQGGDQAGVEGEFVALVGIAPVTDLGDSLSGTFGDMDADGDLDLFVSNDGVNFFYVNQGGAQGGVEGDWVAVTGVDPVLADRASRRAEFGDLDGDGDLDLAVPNVSQANELYRNLGDAGWLSIENAHATTGAGNSRGLAFADLDGDLDLELLVANFDEPTDVFTNTTPDVLVPDPWVDLGNGLAGINGVPELAGNGSLEDDTPVYWQVVDGAPNASTTFLIGIATLFAPFKGGTLVPTPDILIPGIPTDSNGFYFFGVNWPASVPQGAQLFFQVFIPDGTAPQGLSATNGLQVTSP